jgi:hypothetical protein
MQPLFPDIEMRRNNYSLGGTEYFKNIRNNNE